MSLRPGVRLGPYEVVELIGAGGMGDVYRARDPRLGRDVAIKVLPPDVATDSDRLRRLQEEARAVAALSHPHICQIFDVGPDYLVLEFIDGRPLSGPLPASRALDVAVQVASALEAAHSRGILHRDLKPQNVMLTTSGAAKLLDFGLAKIAVSNSDDAATRTTAGTVLGTIAYMSPEQASGKAVDHRSDIFSFGALLYELLSGQRAFPGATVAEVASAALRDEPQPIAVSPSLQAIIRRCVAKDPAQRFQTMADVRLALSATQASATNTGEATASIVVLPFANLTPDRDNEYFSDGLAEEIINALVQISGLKVIARTSAFAFKGQHIDVRRIAATLGVTHVLEGSVRKAGNRIRVTAQLITASDGSHEWSERYDRDVQDVFAIQDDIAGAIAGTLQTKLIPHATVRRYTPALPAYEAFLRGRHHVFQFTPDASERGLEAFKRAIELDPGFARPHAEIGLASLLSVTNGYRSMVDMAATIRESAETALRLDPSEPAPHWLLGALAAVWDYDWRESQRRFRLALETASQASDVHWGYGSFYLQPLGRFGESVAEMERQVQVDPLNVSWRAVLAAHLNHAERFHEAIEQATTALSINEHHWGPAFMLAQSYGHLGRWDEAREFAERAYRGARWNGLAAGVLAGVSARSGRRDRADEVLREMGDDPRPLYGRVEYHLWCGEIDRAADWYARAIEARDPFCVVFAQAPLGRELRASPHWRSLAAAMNLPLP